MYVILCVYLPFCLCLFMCVFFFFKQKTAYEWRISDWSSDVCSSDLLGDQYVVDSQRRQHQCSGRAGRPGTDHQHVSLDSQRRFRPRRSSRGNVTIYRHAAPAFLCRAPVGARGECWSSAWVKSPTRGVRSEEHTSELQSLMRISYAVFCLKKKTFNTHL